MDQIRRGIGRPGLDSQADDAAILGAWRAAQAEGITRRQFAAHRSMNVDDLERVLQRVSKRQAKDQRRA